MLVPKKALQMGGMHSKLNSFDPTLTATVVMNSDMKGKLKRVTWTLPELKMTHEVAAKTIATPTVQLIATRRFNTSSSGAPLGMGLYILAQVIRPAKKASIDTLSMRVSALDRHSTLQDVCPPYVRLVDRHTHIAVWGATGGWLAAHI